MDRLGGQDHLRGRLPARADGEKRRRFFFDHQGKLIGHFGIAHVPAIVAPSGQALKVSEIELPGRHVVNTFWLDSLETPTGTLALAGTAQVWRSANPLARLLCNAMRLPAA